jgi:hypothetical protein
VASAFIAELACEAYLAYGRVTGYKNHQGNPMPAFDDLGDTIQEAWYAAVERVYELTCAGMDD